MAKYLDLTGLQSYHNGVKTLLNNKVDKVSEKGLSTNDYSTTEKNKLSGIAAGAQVNVIESIKVNGTALTPSSKAVNVTVPTRTSQITNDSGFITTHQDISGKEDKSNKVSAFQATPDNTHYPTEKLVKDSLNAKLATSLKGAVNGLAELDSTGKVPSSQLPSYVDDVIEVASYSNLPTTGETGKIYVTLDTNKTYRWSGTAYVEISASLALGETSTTAYRGDRGKTAYDHSQSSHAPSTAEKNIIVGVQVNGSDLTVDANRKVNVVISGKEDKSNKIAVFQTTPDDTHYPTEKLVKSALAYKSDVGHTHSIITDNYTASGILCRHDISLKGSTLIPTFTTFNESRGDDVDFEIFHEGNLEAITSAEIASILAS